MSDNIQHLDLDDDEFLDAPRALRDYVKKLQKQNQNLSTELSTANGKLASQALGEVLSGYKNPKRVERDLLADKIDPNDKAAVDRWLSEFGDDYAKGEASAQAPAQPETPVADDQEQAAHRQLQQAASDLTSPADMTKLEAAQAEITSEMTGAQVVEVMRKHGL